MTKCEKMEMFINDNPDITIKFMIWEDKILKQDNNDNTGISDIDFDIID
jgi:hypothetical protein